MLKWPKISFPAGAGSRVLNSGADVTHPDEWTASVAIKLVASNYKAHALK